MGVPPRLDEDLKSGGDTDIDMIGEVQAANKALGKTFGEIV